MKQNKKLATVIGCILTIAIFSAMVLVGWNHMVKITKGPKNKNEIGYYQWNSDDMDTFSDITTFTYQGEHYETADGGGDGVMSFGYLEASMKGRKPTFWLKETMSQQDKKIAKTISWWKGAVEPVYELSSKSGCKMVFLNPSDKDMMQTVFWKVKDRQKLEAYYMDYDNYNFKLTESKTNKQKEISSAEVKRYGKLQQIREDAENVKKQYNIYGESKDHIAYVEFDIVTVGGKQYLGKYEEW